MDVVSTGFGILLAVILLVGIGLLFMVSRLFYKVEQGKALIVPKINKVDASLPQPVHPGGGRARLGARPRSAETVHGPGNRR